MMLRLTGLVLGGFGPALLVAALLVLDPVAVQATPKFAQQTSKACTACHAALPTLNEAGRKFKENGNKF